MNVTDHHKSFRVQLETFFQMIIIATCIEFGKKLFEKFDVKTGRHEQADNWNEVITKLSRVSIHVSSAAYLRKRVLNWIGRATVNILFE